ncbi:IclR family transcriptional regulator [Labrys sp. KNU-23]|uniref:IclR family transcriptional regulator n=1 Tax=Labrys sp. KNU-23 TaxID=2789216 RepID=UPI0011EF147D|nr:IclR family transcriptional regulator [Labrys sp. KNU-23]QEN85378.1 IclR family transcriptional regulator [Labrys sp. KNU-23]
MSTIGKALSLLDTVSRLEEEAGLTDIARLCGLDKATTRRFLVELTRHGFVEQDPMTRKYRIGAAPVRLARIREARYPFLCIALPHIKALAEASAETVHLSEFSGGQLATIHVEDSPRAHRVIVDVGGSLPFHATASGLAFLAFRPATEIAAALASPLERFTEHTITDPARIGELLGETRIRGFSIGHQGFEVGVVSVAAPIRSPSGEPIGCIAVAAPTMRVGKTALQALGIEAVATAEAISQQYYGLEQPSGTNARPGNARLGNARLGRTA